MSYDVAVIGSGFSAISAVINLLRLLPEHTSIAIVGDDSGFGRGTAYRTELHLHRLNVPAARMSAFADKPDDFLEWLEKRQSSIDAGGFASRHDYGLYLRDTLASLMRAQSQRGRVHFIKAKAVTCSAIGQGASVFSLNDGRSLQASNVVLCLGVGTASLPRLTSEPDMALLRRVVRNPWRLGWLSKVQPDDTVRILGSGLTMIDQVLSLRSMGHRGRIHVLSRRGLVPHAHSRVAVHPVEPDLKEGRREISQMLADLRRQVRSGVEWRAVMDGLRPKTQAVWQQLNADQRSRFLRHALAWWNIHRHRVAPQVFEGFSQLIDDRTVTVHGGFVQKIARGAEGNLLTYRIRGSQTEETVAFDWLVNCTGMERAGIGHSPLLQNMKEMGLLEMDPLGLGIRVDEHSRIANAQGSACGVFAIGALTAGQFWEITAVPDIRVQSRKVAETIAQSVAAEMPEPSADLLKIPNTK